MSEAVKKRIVDELITQLNTVGVDFAEDAWREQAPDEYGVVSQRNINSLQWADGHIVNESHNLDVYLYVNPGSSGWWRTVTEKLEEIGDDLLLSYTMPERSYLYDIDKVMWHWTVIRYGPDEWTEETPEAENDGADDD